jgi:hypothetical protein
MAGPQQMERVSYCKSLLYKRLPLNIPNTESAGLAQCYIVCV